MCTLLVRDILNDAILVSRESARLLEDALRRLTTRTDGIERETDKATVIVDFQGVQGIAPSFIDELITIFESLVDADRNGNGIGWRLTVANPPTRLSRKFEAVARGHGMIVRVAPDGSWTLVGSSGEKQRQ